MNSGIYCILQLSTGRHYIGSASCFRKRKHRHLHDLRNGKHNNAKLQRAWNKYGEADFRFDVLERCDKSALIEREQFYLDSTRPFFNILRKAGSAAGYKHTDEARAKNRERQLAYLASLTDEERARYYATRGESKKGGKHTDEHRQKIASAMKGRETTEAQKAAFEAAKKRPEAVAKRIAARACIWYVATAPDGTEHEFQNMCEFARRHGLQQGHMVAVARGKRNQHKGWTCRYRDEAPAPDRINPVLQR